MTFDGMLGSVTPQSLEHRTASAGERDAARHLLPYARIQDDAWRSPPSMVGVGRTGAWQRAHCGSSAKRRDGLDLHA
jgi:hypothetical protein